MDCEEILSNRGKRKNGEADRHRIATRTICPRHCRNFSDCLRYHASQHPYWEEIKAIYQKLPTNYHLANENRSLLALATKIHPNKASFGIIARDPLESLGLDIMRDVMFRLDARSLARCGATCKTWRSLAHSDALWISKCTGLWHGKRHIPAAALLPGLSKLAAYGISIKDSRRCLITVEDLCQHSWDFRFKDTVPEYWLELDPSRRGQPPMQRYFHADFSHTAGPDDAVWGGHESNFTIIQDDDGSSFVRINHWPEMAVSRTEDWGWELHNKFWVYRSLPDSWRGEEPSRTGIERGAREP